MDLNPAAAEVPPQSQTSAENNLVKQEEGSSLKNDEDVGMPDQTGSAGGSDVAVKKEDGEAGEREESGARRASGEGGQDGESSEDGQFSFDLSSCVPLHAHERVVCMSS